MGSRWYAQELSRFTTEDTADPKPSDPESYNAYLYADDAPLARIDPLGESWWNPWDWAKATGRGIRRVARGFRNLVLAPLGRMVYNSVSWVARTTSSLARGLGRWTMATLRGLKKAAVTTGRGIRGGWRGFTNVVTGGAGKSNFGRSLFSVDTLKTSGKALNGFVKGFPQGVKGFFESIGKLVVDPTIDDSTFEFHCSCGLGPIDFEDLVFRLTLL